MPFIYRKTLTQIFFARAQATPDLEAFFYKPTYPDSGDPVRQDTSRTGWRKLTFRQYYDWCRQISYGLMGSGIEPGDRVAIFSHTRVEWSLSDMAILGARAVTVPIYPSSTAEDTFHILNNSEAKAIIVEDAVQLEKVLSSREKSPGALPLLKKIIVIEPSAMKIAVNPEQNIQDVVTLQSIREIGRREEARNPKRFEQNLGEAEPSDLVTICYTTGTTGTPKGVPLTHDNFVSALEDAIGRVSAKITPENETLLSFLPFSHVLGKIESLAVHVVGARQAFAESIERLPANMMEIRPTVLFAVPRIFEKAYNRVTASIAEAPLAQRKLFDWAVDVGHRAYEARAEGKRPSLAVAAQNRMARDLVFSKVKARFGGRLRYAIVGGSPLHKSIAEFFEIAGIRILEGYGLTETSAPITLNDPDRPRFGTVGKPLNEVSLKIAEDGEILVKSRKVFKGYYKLPEETERALQDGWFHTGDIGYIDDFGALHITDRKKDLIKTSGGKYVAPQKIEKLAKSHKLISEFVVHGEQRKYLVALLTLSREAVIQYANEHNILFSEYSELIKHPKILSLVEKTIGEVNSHLASFETIKKFMILPNDFTIESGELTASLKVRRNVVNQRYKAELDRLYEM